MDISSLLTQTDDSNSRHKTADENAGYKDDEMDGDSSHRAMQQGASAGLKDQDLGAGIHEDSKPRAEPVGEKTTGHAPIFDSKGAVGKQFTTEGALGGAAQKIGGPLSADGAVGKHFTEEGKIGGSVQQTLGSKEGTSIDHSK